MNVYIPFIIFMAISCRICVCDYNSTVQFKRRHIKDIDVLRQIINQETLIRLSFVKEVRAVVEDVSSVKKSMASTERMTSSLQQTLETLKRQVASLSQSETLVHKVETMEKQMDALNQNNTLQQTVEKLKQQVALLSENDTLAQKLETLKKQIDALSHNSTLHQTVKTLKGEVDLLRRDKTLQNAVESLKREFKSQRQEDWKILENCQNRFQEIDQKFKILNENITDIYQYINKTEKLEKEFKLKRDCKDHFLLGHTHSGVYKIYPFGNESRVNVYCDMVTEGGGWTAIQKRGNGSVSFKKNWAEYKKGFGNPSDSYWIGNDIIHQLTKGRNSSLYVSITLKNGRTLYELYQQFSVADESDKYKLYLGGPVTGTLGDMLLDNGYSIFGLSGMPFTTYDRDNDRYKGINCAVDYGGGWWFNACHAAQLNGPWNSDQWVNPWYPKVTSGSSVTETIMLIKPY